jgi:anthranilate phosphoribosyltransferase
VIGVFSEALTEPLAEVLGRLGSRRALVVHGEGNLDELTVTGSTRVSDLHEGKVSTYTITPEELGLPRATLADLKGGATAQESAAQMRAILGGELGAKRDMVLINSGAALMAAGVVTDLQAGVGMAAEIIDSGKALAKLEQLVAFCRDLN